MDYKFLLYYSIVSIFFALVDINVAILSLKKGGERGKYLGYTALACSVVAISYLGSISTDNYFYVSLTSSLYFISIDIMLVFLVMFTASYTQIRLMKNSRILGFMLQIYLIFEIIVFTINIGKEICISYKYRGTPIAPYVYDMKFLYYMHLIFTYSMVLVVLIKMLYKCVTTPKEYRMQFIAPVLGIVVIVGVNAIFLYLPVLTIYSLLDYSICGYSIVLALTYWGCFQYSDHGMLNVLKSSIFENIDQGLVLFDYEGTLILVNKKAKELLVSINIKDSMSQSEFLEDCQISMIEGGSDEGFSLQCYMHETTGIHPLRCDYRSLKNARGQILGQLFTFTDAALDTDLLTGFHAWESFHRFADSNPDSFGYPLTVAIIDINGLSVINSTQGRNVGDRKIKELADIMHEAFPASTYFVRGEDANLIAICYHTDDKQVLNYLKVTETLYDGELQYSFGSLSHKNSDILELISSIQKAMRQKKLLDQGSSHSAMLTSLIRALQECDSDTEAHVQRTQQLGAELGARIGLNDIQQSDLSLLCLLHDIGKIGIPLDILNKPGKLTDGEWRTIQTHVEKGYQIAKSSKDLEGIADMILHHHERWDGKGYPDGLSKETIPVLSRVIAVVDAYDAMVNTRSYRKAISKEKAMEELRRCAGTQFDPSLVSEFLQMLKEEPNEVVNTIESNSPEKRTMESVFESTRENTPNYSIHPVKFTKYILDEAQRIILTDSAFEEITGYSQEDIRQRTLRQEDLIPQEDLIDYLCIVSESGAKSENIILEHRISRKDGSMVYVYCHGRKYFDSVAREQRSEIICFDSSTTYAVKMLADAEKDRAQARLKYWENTYRKDSLTGLLNHAAFKSDVELKLLENQDKVIMLMMDLDHFKDYNDTCGHRAGDELLILVAESLTTSLRKNDLACRMGGDEFAAALFFNKADDDTVLNERAQQIFDKMNMTLKTYYNNMGLSMGTAIADDNIRTFNELYEASDQALYISKNGGRGRISNYKK